MHKTQHFQSIIKTISPEQWRALGEEMLERAQIREEDTGSEDNESVLPNNKIT